MVNPFLFSEEILPNHPTKPINIIMIDDRRRVVEECRRHFTMHNLQSAIRNLQFVRPSPFAPRSPLSAFLLRH